jgi:hypothetical protein
VWLQCRYSQEARVVLPTHGCRFVFGMHEEAHDAPLHREEETRRTYAAICGPSRTNHTRFESRSESVPRGSSSVRNSLVHITIVLVASKQSRHCAHGFVVRLHATFWTQSIMQDCSGGIQQFMPYSPSGWLHYAQLTNDKKILPNG